MLHIKPPGRFMITSSPTHTCLRRMIPPIIEIQPKRIKMHESLSIYNCAILLRLTLHATRHTKVSEKLPQRNGKRHVHGILKHFQVLKLRSAQQQESATIHRFAYHLSEFFNGNSVQLEWHWNMKKNKKNLNGSSPIYITRNFPFIWTDQKIKTLI